MRKTVSIIILLMIVISFGYIAIQKRSPTQKVNSIRSFEDCKAAGYPILESYPAQCKTNEGQIFTQYGDWVSYADGIYSFLHPKNWNPKKLEVLPNHVHSVSLGIPQVDSDQVIGFSQTDEVIKPNDAISETLIQTSEINGVKWIRKGVGYVSYDYSMTDKPYLYIHVSVSERNNELEKELDYLFTTLTFNRQKI